MSPYAAAQPAGDRVRLRGPYAAPAAAASGWPVSAAAGQEHHSGSPGRQGGTSMGLDDKAKNKAQSSRGRPRRPPAGPPTTSSSRPRARPTRPRAPKAGRREGQGHLPSAGHLPSHRPAGPDRGLRLRRWDQRDHTGQGADQHQPTGQVGLANREVCPTGALTRTLPRSASSAHRMPPAGAGPSRIVPPAATTGSGRPGYSPTASCCRSGRVGRRPVWTRASPARAAGCPAGPPHRPPGTRSASFEKTGTRTARSS
jgi:hypothetical protein